MKIGYARVSSSGQHLDVQQTALTDAGCEKIYAEKAQRCRGEDQARNRLC